MTLKFTTITWRLKQLIFRLPLLFFCFWFEKTRQFRFWKFAFDSSLSPVTVSNLAWLSSLTSSSLSVAYLSVFLSVCRLEKISLDLSVSLLNQVCVPFSSFLQASLKSFPKDSHFIQVSEGRLSACSHRLFRLISNRFSLNPVSDCPFGRSFSESKFTSNGYLFPSDDLPSRFTPYSCINNSILWFSLSFSPKRITLWIHCLAVACLTLPEKVPCSDCFEIISAITCPSFKGLL